MNNNTHYHDALLNRPALVRGPDELIRKHMDNQMDATLALAHEQRIANLTALLSVDEFQPNRIEIVAKIREMTGIQPS